MATGLIAWTCLMLAAGTPDDVFYMNQRDFQIPIRIEPQRKSEVAKLLLYVSTDQGRSWAISSRADPDQKSFDFKASGDGLLYFSIAVVDRTGRQNPPDVYKAPVNQKIVVDTTRPLARITGAEFAEGKVRVGWDIREERPDWATLKLEYRSATAAGGPWTPLPIQQREHGDFEFRPVIAGDLVLRLSLRDLAGNEGVEERKIGGGALAAVSGQGGPIRPVGNDTAAPALSMPAPPGGVANSMVVPPPGIGSAMPPPPSAEPAPPGRPVEPMSTGRPTDAAASVAPAAAGAGDAGGVPIMNRGALPPLQIVNKPQVTLGYGVTGVGPSGLGSVEVYVTSNEGVNWDKMAAESVSATDPGKVVVKLPRDGQIFGFYIVVRSRAGLGKPGPNSGDTPQVRVEADTTVPSADLFSPQADPARSEALLLTWKAEDRNIETSPITLEWSADGRDGWAIIGEPQLPNTGRYSWTVPANVPPKVYLKLTVRDAAGNVAVAQTNAPVLIDLSRPAVTTVSVVK